MGTSHGPSFGKEVPHSAAERPDESRVERVAKAKRNWAKQLQLCYPNYWDDLGKFMDKITRSPIPHPEFLNAKILRKNKEVLLVLLDSIISLPYRQNFPRSDRLNRFQACWGLQKLGFVRFWKLKLGLNAGNVQIFRAF
jgi:hypothetical protein